MLEYVQDRLNYDTSSNYLDNQVSMFVLDVRGLVKVYGGGVVALRDVSFRAARSDSVLVVMGPNGAGKTTLVRIVAGLVKPTRGEVLVLGHDVVKEPYRVRKLIALLPQDARPISEVSPYEYVYYFLLSRGFSSRDSKRLTCSILKELELWDFRNCPSIKLSGGLRRRMLIAPLLVCDAEVVILDEPTLGLDPKSRYHIWSIIRKEAKDKFFLVTTNYGQEAEALATTLLYLNKGQLVVFDTLENILRKIEYNMKIITKHDAYLKISEKLGKLDAKFLVKTMGDQAIIYVNKRDLHCITELLTELEVPYSIDRVTADDIFMLLT